MERTKWDDWQPEHGMCVQRLWDPGPPWRAPVRQGLNDQTKYADLCLPGGRKWGLDVTWHHSSLDLVLQRAWWQSSHQLLTPARRGMEAIAFSCFLGVAVWAWEGSTGVFEILSLSSSHRNPDGFPSQISKLLGLQNTWPILCSTC